MPAKVQQKLIYQKRVYLFLIDVLKHENVNILEENVNVLRENVYISTCKPANAGF
jgi:hypothetical protein